MDTQIRRVMPAPGVLVEIPAHTVVLEEKHRLPIDWSVSNADLSTGRATLSLPVRQLKTSSAPSANLAEITNKLRVAILRCAAQAQTDEPNDTEARLHSFVAKLSGNMESMGEIELDRALWDLFGTPWPPAHSVLPVASNAAVEPIAGI